MKTLNTLLILPTLILLFVPTTTASTSSETPFPEASVEVVADEIEVEWLPEATVQIVESEIEIEQVAQDRNVVCGEYTCTFTPMLRAER